MATTSAEGVAPGTSTMSGPEPLRSVSAPSSAAQLVGAQKSVVEPLKTGPGRRRMTASFPAQVTPEPFPVVTKVFVPSLATPPGAHTPALAVPVAQFITL